jgi:K+ transporter
MSTWFCLVLPCLVLNYAGQVGYILEHGVPARANTFYALNGSQWQVPVFEQQTTLVYTGIHAVTLHVNGRDVELVC